MWRAFFLAIGVFLVILGVECLGVERVQSEDPRQAAGARLAVRHRGQRRGPKQIIPPPWAPWSLLSSGAVMCLYSFTIPRRVAGN